LRTASPRAQGARAQAPENLTLYQAQHLCDTLNTQHAFIDLRQNHDPVAFALADPTAALISVPLFIGP
jgi:hypothetical protein